jgi:hypothetical protein
MEDKPDLVIGLTGEVCELGGFYWASGCGHADVKEFAVSQIFPSCKTCSHQIRWLCRVHPDGKFNP